MSRSVERFWLYWVFSFTYICYSESFSSDTDFRIWHIHAHLPWHTPLCTTVLMARPSLSFLFYHSPVKSCDGTLQPFAYACSCMCRFYLQLRYRLGDYVPTGTFFLQCFIVAQIPHKIVWRSEYPIPHNIVWRSCFHHTSIMRYVLLFFVYVFVYLQHYLTTFFPITLAMITHHFYQVSLRT